MKQILLTAKNHFARLAISLSATIIRTTTDALFPLPTAEKELLAMNPVSALKILPKSPLTPVAQTYSVFHYKDERVAKMIWHIKYKRSKKATEIGGYALFREIEKIISEIHLRGAAWDSDHIGERTILIIPTPITSRRRKERGYNQCELLLDEVKRLFDEKNLSKTESDLGTDVTEKPSPTIIFEKDLLERVHHNSRQTLKNRHDRLDSAKGIFGINEKTARKIEIAPTQNTVAKNYTVIIIDDVITTGSTIKEAMQTVSDFVFKDVVGVSVAH